MHHVKKALEEMEFSQFQGELDEAFKIYKANADEKKAASGKDNTKQKGKKKADEKETKEKEKETDEGNEEEKEEGKESEEGNDHGSESS